MNQALAAQTVSELRKLTVAEADRKLCAMTLYELGEIAKALDITLPRYGGDKPAIIIGQLKLKG